jgi:hypothetical protein
MEPGFISALVMLGLFEGHFVQTNETTICFQENHNRAFQSLDEITFD